MDPGDGGVFLKAHLEVISACRDATEREREGDRWELLLISQTWIHPCL